MQSIFIFLHSICLLFFIFSLFYIFVNVVIVQLKGGQVVFHI